MILLLVAAGGVYAADTAYAAETGVIESAGPLSRIATSPDLNCAVDHVGDSSAEFYGGTACATLVAVDGILYGPADIPAGSGAGPRTPFTPVSQAGPAGTGSLTDPWKVTTVVALGEIGLRLTQVDTYVTGQESYTTTLTLDNSGTAARDVLVYRAGDCYVADSDSGKGHLSDAAVACVAESGRVEQWIPSFSPYAAARYEAGYAEVWSLIGRQQPFPNTCRCEETIDNGGGLSWSLSVPAGAGRRVAHQTAFSPDQAQADRDSDGLPDRWETDGLDLNDDGQVDVDLPAMGASADHKDLFVEVDWMEKDPSCVWFVCWGGNSFQPQQAALDDVRAAFAAAPVTNPDGTTGVRAHFDSGRDAVMNPVTGAKWGDRSRAGKVAYSADLGAVSGGEYSWAAYNALQNANFDQARADVFHYAVFADRYGGGTSSGIARITDTRFSGDAFLVTDGAWGGFSRRQESGTFMHELGHTLGLHHGGGDDVNNKPNFLSILNYSWQMGERPLDYSRAELPALDEAALDERTGVAGATGPVGWQCAGGAARTRDGAGATDWNCNDRTDAGPVAADVNQDGARGVLRGHDDWPALTFDGGAVGAFGVSDLDDQSPPPVSTPADEPTLQQFQAAHAAGADGDGSVRFAGPTVLLAGVTGQQLYYQLTNVGETSAAYRIDVAGLPSAPATVETTVAGGTTALVGVPVDATGLPAGVRHLTATLHAATGDGALSLAESDVTVPDLTDPAVLEAARAAAQQLATDQPGLDDAVRTGLLTALNAATGGGKLAAPTGATAAAGDRSATVTWTPPATTGTAPITGYVVTAQPGGRTVQVAGDQTSAVISGLTNGRTYTFTVTARNARGTGEPSAPSNAVTPAAARRDYLGVRVSGARSWVGGGTAAATAFTATRQGHDLTRLSGSATVDGYAVSVDLKRSGGRLRGNLSVKQVRSGQQVAATSVRVQRAYAAQLSADTLLVTIAVPGSYRTGRAARPAMISLIVVDHR